MYIDKRRGLKTMPWDFPTFIGEGEREPAVETKKEASEAEEINRGGTLGSDEASFLRKRE